VSLGSKINDVKGLFDVRGKPPVKFTNRRLLKMRQKNEVDIFTGQKLTSGGGGGKYGYF
jgi:hypothetical protein